MSGIGLRQGVPEPACFEEAEGGGCAGGARKRIPVSVARRGAREVVGVWSDAFGDGEGIRVIPQIAVPTVARLALTWVPRSRR